MKEIYTDNFEKPAEKVAVDASSLHLTAFKRRELEKDFKMQIGCETGRLHNLRRSPRAKNTDVITRISSHVNVNYFFCLSLTISY